MNNGSGPRTRRRRPTFEDLEGRQLMTSSISGFVFDDNNNNGLFDSGEAPLRGSALELRNSSGIVVATATSNTSGAYEFTTDRTISTAPTTRTVLVSFSDSKTAWTKSSSVAQFDPALGRLTGVSLRINATMVSQMRLENLDDESGDVGAQVDGTVVLTGPGISGASLNLTAGTQFSAPAFDGNADLSGSSSRDSGQVRDSESRTLTLSSAADLAQYTGTGTVSLSGRASSRNTTDGPGNVLARIDTRASAQIQVTYSYIPNNCLRPGTYRVTQVTSPQGYIDGKESSGGQIVPGSIGRDTITVNLGNGPSRHNDFGEVRPGLISGYVYLDINKNGIRESGEGGFPGITLELSGENDTGAIGRVRVQTNSQGQYSFGPLRPGRYTVTQIGNPNGFLSYLNSMGNKVPLPIGSPDILGVFVINSGDNRPENNFGKVLPGPIIPQVTDTPRSKFNLLSSTLRKRR